MRILFLSDFATVILDIVSWIIFHLSIGHFCSKIPVERFDPEKRWYQTKPWEKDGEIYQRLFRVKDWKKWIPSGAALYKNAYEIKHLTEISIENVKLWIRESCRSEFCHYVMVIPGFFFFLWNSVEISWCMMAYAIMNNLVPIIMQRYNRPRARKLLSQLERKINQKDEQITIYGPQTVFLNSH